MLKIFLILIVLLNISSQVLAVNEAFRTQSSSVNWDLNFTNGKINGRGWIASDQMSRYSYIRGFVEGLQYSARAKITDLEPFDDICKKALGAISDVKKNFIIDVSYGETMKYLNEFFNNPSNLDIPVNDAYYIMHLEYNKKNLQLTNANFDTNKLSLNEKIEIVLQSLRRRYKKF